MATSSRLAEPTISTDILIVGTGPAGGSLASFLGSYGIKGLMISRNSSTATEPRAHIFNPAAFECMRDIGLEQALRDVGLKNSYYGEHRFCQTLAGKDLLRFRSFSVSPGALGGYTTVSPCEHEDVSQNLVEPILLKFATQNGFQVRFNSKFLDYTEDSATGLITSTIEDQVTKQIFRVVSKYLCGADGSNSAVARRAKLPFHTVHEGGFGGGGGNALNIWYEADLTHLYQRNPGLIHLISTPLEETPPWSTFGANRVVRPYTEFLMTFFAAPGVDFSSVSQDQAVARLRKLIGDPDVAIRVKGLSRWRINESYATALSAGGEDGNIIDPKVFCLGDAISRHSPAAGLGSNTSIQDSYNLAWKLAAVLNGRAGPALLRSYTAERQPVAEFTVHLTTQFAARHAAVMSALGLLDTEVDARRATLELLDEASDAGRAKRRELRAAAEQVRHETAGLGGLGGEMNHRYDGQTAAAICVDDELGPAPEFPQGMEGARVHVPSTYPGSRLPHAWLEAKGSPPGERVSTHDLAGHGRWVLFTGIGGLEVWGKETARVQKELGVEVGLKGIGRGLEFADCYYMWEDLRDVEETGAVLVRPDRVVAWRSWDSKGSEKLLGVLRNILAL